MLEHRGGREEHIGRKDRDVERVHQRERRSKRVHRSGPHLVDDGFSSGHHDAGDVIEYVGLGQEVAFDNQLASERTVVAGAIAGDNRETVRGIGQRPRVGEMSDVADAVDGDSADAHQAHFFLAIHNLSDDGLHVGVDHIAPDRIEVRTGGLLLPRKNGPQGDALQILTRHFRQVGDAVGRIH